MLRMGHLAIWFAAGCSILLSLYLYSKGFWLALGLPLVWIVPPLVGWLITKPTMHLTAILAGFVVMVGFGDGISLSEATYGLYYLSYLLCWMVHWRLAQNRPLTGRFEDRALLLFFILITLTIPLSVLQRADPTFILGEWLSYTLLLFYWPVRERITADPRALRMILHALIIIGLFVLVRNLLEYRSDLAGAEYAWQIAKSRAATNESLLMVSSFIALSYSVRAEKWGPRLTYLGLFLGLFGGLILTQSRAYWVASVIGLGFMLIFLPPAERKRMLISGIVSTVVLVSLSIILLGDLVSIVATGFYYRMRSLATATSADISLVNRFLEARGAIESIKWNPVMGYGMGVPYRFYNITYNYSEVKSFIHNGYVALLFKFGIWGFMLMMSTLSVMIWRGWQVLRSSGANDDRRVACVVVVASFSALAVTALTANPFFQNDLMFVYAVLLGVAGGCYNQLKSEQTRQSKQSRPSVHTDAS